MDALAIVVYNCEWAISMMHGTFESMSKDERRGGGGMKEVLGDHVRQPYIFLTGISRPWLS